ncbi:MAG: AGE family epimerase/isomerase, partial [Gemmatimonadota bacterium]
MIEFMKRRWYRLLQPRPVDPGPLRPVTLQEGESKVREVLDTAPRLEKILMENIVPFWATKTLDEEHGGYLLNHDLAGHLKASPEKACVPQSRMIWFFSRLFREGYLPDAKPAARQGFEFLRSHLWDQAHGGFLWSVSPDGASVVDGTKRLYAQTFALYALAEFALAFDEGEAMELCELGWRAMRDQLRDQRHGGFHLELDRDWSPLDPAGPRGKT